VSETTRRYRDDTTILDTDHVTDAGRVRVTDLMPWRDGPSSIIRIVEGLEGEVQMAMSLRLRFGYGQIAPWRQRHDRGLIFEAGPDRVVLDCPVELTMNTDDASARFVVAKGTRIAFVLAYSPSIVPLPSPLKVDVLIEATEKEWKGWIGRFEATGCHNGAALWRRVKVAGFAGAPRVVAEWATRRRKEEAMTTGDGRPRKVPSARGVARMMTVERDVLSKTVAHTMAIIAGAVPALVIARDLMDRFHRMTQHRTSADLEPWIADATPGLLGSFAKGIVQDRAGVNAALTQPWSNGQTEGQNTKLKLVKRQMYGRANLDLLQAHLLGAA
jgi:hypothetical protein